MRFGFTRTLLARLDAGRPLERRPVDLTRLLIEAVSDARVVAPDHHWRLDLPDEAIEVDGDERRLHQVVTNLLTNAEKYGDGAVRVTVTADADHVRVFVDDAGEGVPPEDRDRIFERFYRVDPARHRSTGGTGLGLSIVKHVAASHGGDVTVWSVEGQGSTFTLSLPRDNQEGRP